ncbi:MAG: (2Fe-2S)-binding protein, partial [Gammaproteobacteria bacterium]|nr:(2Fe-2S)-binding protein [Gammaproteobacteria bacterium]
MSAMRTAQGGHIDRTRSLDFTWQGKRLSGHAGDTLASALLANNISVLCRSFKYHRPRGLMSCGVEESGALVTIGQGDRRDANVRATTQELYQGLQATGQNAWPNVRFDLGAVNSLFSRFFAAGFYYKTFMGIPPLEWGQGTGAWMWYEKLIRRAAGMGTASTDADPDRYEHAHAFCDVLVVGAGPAGIHAALTAANAGLDVWLVEQDSDIGGGLFSRGDAEARAEHEQSRSELSASGVTVMPRTTAFGLYDHGVAGLLQRVTDHQAAPSAYLPRQRFWTLRANYTVLATGAIERSLAFGNNDRPGIMTATAAQTYLHRFGVLAGQRIVIATNNDSAYPVATDLANAGAGVQLLDARDTLAHPATQHAARNAGVAVAVRAAPMDTQGRTHIHSVTTAALAGESWRRQSRTACDLLLVSGGWSPVVNLLSHRGIKPQWDKQRQAFLPPADYCSSTTTVAATAALPLIVAGSAEGIWNHQGCIESGRRAGQQAVQFLSTGSSTSHQQALSADAATPSVSSDGGWLNPIQPLFEVRESGSQRKSFIDPQHDVTADDVRLAHREGFESVEHLKRYTTLGMATDQGKVGNVLGIALMADALGCDIGSVGTTTFRPPYTPVSLGALRGRHVGAHFRPLRRTPLHDWNLS